MNKETNKYIYIIEISQRTIYNHLQQVIIILILPRFIGKYSELYHLSFAAVQMMSPLP